MERKFPTFSIITMIKRRIEFSGLFGCVPSLDSGEFSFPRSNPSWFGPASPTISCVLALALRALKFGSANGLDGVHVEPFFYFTYFFEYTIFLNISFVDRIGIHVQSQHFIFK